MSRSGLNGPGARRRRLYRKRAAACPVSWVLGTPPTYAFSPQAAAAYRSMKRDWDYWSRNQWTGIGVGSNADQPGLSIPFTSQQRPGGYHPLSGGGGLEVTNAKLDGIMELLKAQLLHDQAVFGQ